MCVCVYYCTRVPCDYGGQNVAFAVDAGSSPYWLSFAVRYEGGPGDIESVMIRQVTNYMHASCCSTQYFFTIIIFCNSWWSFAIFDSAARAKDEETFKKQFICVLMVLWLCSWFWISMNCTVWKLRLGGDATQLGCELDVDWLLWTSFPRSLRRSDHSQAQRPFSHRLECHSGLLPTGSYLQF